MASTSSRELSSLYKSSSGEGETARRRTLWAEFSLSDENLCESSKEIKIIRTKSKQLTISYLCRNVVKEKKYQ